MLVYPSFDRKETHRENEQFYTPLNLFEKDATVVLFSCLIHHHLLSKQKRVNMFTLLRSEF